MVRVLVRTRLVGALRMVQSLGDSRAAELQSLHDRSARDLLIRNSGLEVDMSDHLLLLFERPADAVAFALAYHQALERLGRQEGVEWAARVGIHIGEVVLRRNAGSDVARGAKPLEVTGLAKTVAARVMALAEPRQTLFWVGFVHWRRRNLDAALLRFQVYLRLSETLVASSPDNLDWRLELASAHSNLGSVLQERDDLEGALQRFRACLAIEEALLEEDTGNQEWRRAVAASHNAVGTVLNSQGRFREALEHHREELALQQDLVAAAPENWQWQRYLAVSHAAVAGALENLGDPVGALEHMRRAEGLLLRLVEHDPTNMTWQRELGMVDLRLGNLLRTSSHLDEALVHAERAVERLEQVAAADPSDAGWHEDLAQAQIVLNRVLAAKGSQTVTSQ